VSRPTPARRAPAQRGARRARRRTGTLPLTPYVGVDNEFGALTWPDGRAQLCEIVSFFVGECTLVDLHTGQRVSAPAHGVCSWTRTRAPEACAQAGIPEPEV
jgi:hypothetical protein